MNDPHYELGFGLGPSAPRPHCGSVKMLALLARVGLLARTQRQRRWPDAGRHAAAAASRTVQAQAGPTLQEAHQRLVEEGRLQQDSSQLAAVQALQVRNRALGEGMGCVVAPACATARDHNSSPNNQSSRTQPQTQYGYQQGPFKNASAASEERLVMIGTWVCFPYDAGTTRLVPFQA